MTPATTLSDLGGHEDVGLTIDDATALEAKVRETDVLRVSSDNAVPKRLDSNGSITQGLGLPLARQIIESHGGTLQLHCAPGEGTTVIMVLPRP
jgi:signal transduction histidine kinase